ncbi:hypothetical protein FN846DRAFT_370927 [Sphaerosporella brunnea]|uniref:Uncharacterized protein n=1 Tax=Sphaerosporella brunnea TaxID=1250544 RepID=A0A5J5EIQ7_9PEZI|nr:hypothetical protein FN846DRAFT_370927 [Sphaerosporella brunnea]
MWWLWWLVWLVWLVWLLLGLGCVFRYASSLPSFLLLSFFFPSSFLPSFLPPSGAQAVRLARLARVGFLSRMPQRTDGIQVSRTPITNHHHQL